MLPSGVIRRSPQKLEIEKSAEKNSQPEKSGQRTPGPGSGLSFSYGIYPFSLQLAAEDLTDLANIQPLPG
jgi:hypothetical protein